MKIGYVFIHQGHTHVQRPTYTIIATKDVFENTGKSNPNLSKGVQNWKCILSSSIMLDHACVTLKPYLIHFNTRKIYEDIK